MIEKFFLALDAKSDESKTREKIESDIIKRGVEAIDALEKQFGKDFVMQRVGVKINEDMVTCSLSDNQAFQIRDFKDELGCSIFVDKKIGHGADTGERIIRNLIEEIPLQYVTVSAGLGTKILGEYVEAGKKYGVPIFAFTVHTKISPEDAQRIYKRPLNDVIYSMSEIAYESGCEAVVLEGDLLKEQRFMDLPIKKLVTGIRIDPEDKGTQSRVTSLETLAQVKPRVNYVVVSSKYVNNPPSLSGYFSALL
jgi:orotidine-5'-phosphate decarboxylase